MTEDEEGNNSSSWFQSWQDQLPSPQDLMPLTQSLITPPLAMAFDIPYEAPVPGLVFDDEPARALKRPRLVWTPQLHKRFVDAVAHLGINRSVPKAIMQLMNVEGLTRENVASHLQKYRLYLKRMQGMGGGGRGPVSAADDKLFASTAVPPQLLREGQASANETYAAYAAQQQIATMQQQQQYCLQRDLGHYGLQNGAGGGGYDHGFLSRAAAQTGIHRMAETGLVQMPQLPMNAAAASYIDELGFTRRGGEAEGGSKKVLTLFPSGED